MRFVENTGEGSSRRVMLFPTACMHVILPTAYFTRIEIGLDALMLGDGHAPRREREIPPRNACSLLPWTSKLPVRTVTLSCQLSSDLDTGTSCESVSR